MGVAGDSNPALGVIGVEELPMAALLAAQHPTLALEPIQDIPNLHVGMLARRGTRSMRRTTRVRHRRPHGQAWNETANGGCLDPMVGRLQRLACSAYRFRLANDSLEWAYRIRTEQEPHRYPAATGSSASRLGSGIQPTLTSENPALLSRGCS